VALPVLVVKLARYLQSALVDDVHALLLTLFALTTKGLNEAFTGATGMAIAESGRDWGESQIDSNLCLSCPFRLQSLPVADT
jgi:hypothetical protein